VETKAGEEAVPKSVLSLSPKNIRVKTLFPFCLQRHAYSFGRTYIVVEGKKGTKVVLAPSHIKLCAAVPTRKCEDVSKCGHKNGHKDVLDKEKEDKRQKKEAKRQQREEHTKQKRAVQEQKKKEKENITKEKAVIKARKLSAKLRNGTLGQFVEGAQLTKETTPTVLNQAIALSNLFTATNPDSLYLPGESKDEGLSMRLAWELQRVDKPPFSTHDIKFFNISLLFVVPTVADYTTAIEDIDHKLQQVDILRRQLRATKDKYVEKRQALYNQRAKVALKRSRSESLLFFLFYSYVCR
jgi:hypothetical protein